MMMMGEVALTRAMLRIGGTAAMPHRILERKLDRWVGGVVSSMGMPLFDPRESGLGQLTGQKKSTASMAALRGGSTTGWFGGYAAPMLRGGSFTPTGFAAPGCVGIIRGGGGGGHPRTMCTDSTHSSRSLLWGFVQRGEALWVHRARPINQNASLFLWITSNTLQLINQDQGEIEAGARQAYRLIAEMYEEGSPDKWRAQSKSIISQVGTSRASAWLLFMRLNAVHSVRERATVPCILLGVLQVQIVCLNRDPPGRPCPLSSGSRPGVCIAGDSLQDQGHKTETHDRKV